MCDIYGGHRVIKPKGALPQAATRIDPDPIIFPNEILIDVIALQPTSTAFNQIRKQCNDDIEAIKKAVMVLVESQGKFQDPVTKSGGILIGTVKEIGKDLAGRDDLQPGDKIATLVSLSLTPLRLSKVMDICMDTDQISVRGTAILFESGIYAKLPLDLPEKLAMAALDVAGAPAQVRINAKPGDIVLVLGAGKAGLLCLQEARNRVFPNGQVVCIEYSKTQCDVVRDLGLAHRVIRADAQNPLETLGRFQEAMGENLADFTVNCVNVPDTEVTTVLLTKNRGLVYYFSMSTNFAKASLGAEGVKKYTRMLIGNGYYPGHAEIVFQIIREHPKLAQYFEDKFVTN
ncbi:MAG: L-erythro-3,5-diaminohexanoate dehydrogenase [Desulfobacteraceae bacterium]|nr:L-erythro-3,5-diaminohexanoate dehydrogenase [Desulfobacteraceae bacterium]